MKKYAFILCLLSLSVAANPLQGLSQLGAGAMRFMWWDIYQAEFYAATPHYQPGQWPQALKLTYQKNISKQELINATADQWQHLKLKHPRQADWLTTLATFWPDIHSGDELILLVTPQGVSEFYFNQLLIGSISEPEFGQHFLAIWLDSATSEPALRQQLLGITP